MSYIHCYTNNIFTCNHVQSVFNNLLYISIIKYFWSYGSRRRIYSLYIKFSCVVKKTIDRSPSNAMKTLPFGKYMLEYIEFFIVKLNSNAILRLSGILQN